MIFDLEGDSLHVDPDVVIVAGFTGRDKEEVDRHLEELRQVGVETPEEVPSFYLVPSLLAVQTDKIVVPHHETSGEVEVAIIQTDGQRWVTVASDHTDRRLEKRDILSSKLACPKVLADVAWPYEDLAAHWDLLDLRSWVDEDVLYQDGKAAELLAPEDLIAVLPFGRYSGSFILLCGTTPAIGGIRAHTAFAAELYDPILMRSIRLSYQTRDLGLLGYDGESF